MVIKFKVLKDNELRMIMTIDIGYNKGIMINIIFIFTI